MHLKKDKAGVYIQAMSGFLVLLIAYNSLMTHDQICETVFLFLFGITHSICAFRSCNICRMYSCYVATCLFLLSSIFELIHHDVIHAFTLFFVGVILDFVGNEEKEKAKEVIRVQRASARANTTI